jgi:hypothetical protein
MRVIEHLPLQRTNDATVEPGCGGLGRLARRARAGDRLLAAGRSELVTLPVTGKGVRPTGWLPTTPGSVTPQAPGRVEAERSTPGGRFRVWMKGSYGRATKALVDGQEAGSAHEINTPSQWVRVGETRLAAGKHRLAVDRPGFGIGPGNAWRGEIGPLALEPMTRPRLVTVAPRDYRELCGREWDWIEVVRT